MKRLDEAIVLIEAGDLGAGRIILEQLLEADEGDDQAWLWLSKAVEEQESHVICLQNVLALNPDNDEARNRLAALGVPTRLTDVKGVRELPHSTGPTQPRPFDEVTAEQRLLMLENLQSLMSFELRTPLTALKGYLDLLGLDKLGPLDEKRAELLKKAKYPLEQLSENIDRIIEYNRILFGQISLNFEEIDLARLLQRYYSENEELSIPDNLPAIWGDVRYLANAFEFLFFWGYGLESRPSLQISYNDKVVTFQILRDPFLFSSGDQPGLGHYIVQTIVEKHSGDFYMRMLNDDQLEVFFTLPIDKNRR